MYGDKYSSSPRALWELRSYDKNSLVCKGDLAFVVKRLTEIVGGQLGLTHFIIPASGLVSSGRKS
jgi:hypothetical protein